jgi:putative oxidoreductase
MLDWAKFDLTEPFNLLRIVCGAFFIPHSVGKVSEWDFSVGFFTKAGFPRPAMWTVVALMLEALVAACLIFGVLTRYAASVGAIFLAVAALATYRVSGQRWYWNFGGAEYCTFWAICCAIVALHG